MRMNESVLCCINPGERREKAEDATKGEGSSPTEEATPRERTTMAATNEHRNATSHVVYVAKREHLHCMPTVHSNRATQTSTGRHRLVASLPTLTQAKSARRTWRGEHQRQHRDQQQHRH